MALTLPHVQSWPTRVALLTLAYVVVGRLALLLAIPPGFATAVFPPVGIALAAVLLWGNRLLAGVFFGSLLLNTWTAAIAAGGLGLQALAISTGIALGTTLQTFVGASLVRRYVRFPTPLTDERDIFLFLSLGGPIACATSASIGVSVLYLTGTISTADFWFTWLTWWVGDTIGVLIASPFMLVLFGEPRKLWRQRTTTVAIPLAVSSAIMVAIFLQSSAWEQQRAELKFHEQSKLIIESVKFRFEVYNKELRSIERFFSSSTNVTRREFHSFVAGTLAAFPGIQALEWAPRVPHDQRAAFERNLVQQGYAGFRVTERDASNTLVTAGVRSEYVPVTYVEPAEGNERVLGYDVSSSAVRRAALAAARDSAGAVMSGRVNLVQGRGDEAGVLIFYPLYRSSMTVSSLEERRQAVRGYAIGVIRIHDLVGTAVAPFPADTFHLQLLDITEGDTPSPLHGPADFTVPGYARNLVWQESWMLAGRQLQLTVWPTAVYLQSARGLQSWSVLAGGLLLCSLLGAFLLTVSGRADKIQTLVDRRTLELRSILDNAVEAIITFGEKGTIESANPAGETLFGYAVHELVGMPISRLIPELCEPDAAGRASAISCGHIDEVLGRYREMRGTRRDQTVFPIEIGVSRVALPDRRVYTCMIHDISERKHVERLKSEFVSTVSHELRTPVTSISGSLGLIAGGAAGALPAKVQELIGIAKNNAERLVNLINDILDIEKLEFGRVEFHMERRDLHALLQQALVQNKGYADTFGVRLTYRDDLARQAPLYVEVDKYRFSQVMSNLISNAVKFSRPGGEVVMATERLGDTIKVLVTDSGPGIPASFRPRLFQKFAQADATDTRRRGGTGLGLSIARTIVERMHGRIDCDSVVGKGTTMYFVLPLVEALVA
jgi:PAS domain S-box-containing protein